MKARMALCFGLLLSLVSANLLADGTDEVLEKLMLFNLANDFDDYDAISEPLLMLLDEDDSETQEISLKKNTHYMISIVCDDDCDDVDVWLYDEDGELVDSDTDSDDTAVIEGRPEESGDYILEIEMVECDREPCNVGAQAFRK